MAGTSGSENKTNKQKERHLNIALCCTVNLSTWEKKRGDQNGGNTNGRNSWKLGQTNLLNLCHWCFRLYYFQILDKMLFKTAQHPIFEYLQTKVNTFIINLNHWLIDQFFQGPVCYANTRLKGNGWYFDCHAIIVLPLQLIPVSLPSESSMLTVFLPEAEKRDVLNYLTFCYTGRWAIV